MIGRINHIAIAVPDVAAAAHMWQSALGAVCSPAQNLPEHGVRIVFVEPNGKVELMNHWALLAIASFWNATPMVHASHLL